MPCSRKGLCLQVHFLWGAVGCWGVGGCPKIYPCTSTCPPRIVSAVYFLPYFYVFTRSCFRWKLFVLAKSRWSTSGAAFQQLILRWAFYQLISILVHFHQNQKRIFLERRAKGVCIQWVQKEAWRGCPAVAQWKVSIFFCICIHFCLFNSIHFCVCIKLKLKPTSGTRLSQRWDAACSWKQGQASGLVQLC